MTPIAANVPDNRTVSVHAEANGHLMQVPSDEGASIEQRKEWDRVWLQIFGENYEFFHAHENELLKEHPEWRGLYVALSCRTPSKIVAVHGDSRTLFEQAEHFPEVERLACELNVPPGYLFSPHFLGDIYFDS